MIFLFCIYFNFSAIVDESWINLIANVSPLFFIFSILKLFEFDKDFRLFSSDLINVFVVNWEFNLKLNEFFLFNCLDEHFDNSSILAFARSRRNWTARFICLFEFIETVFDFKYLSDIILFSIWLNLYDDKQYVSFLIFESLLIIEFSFKHWDLFLFGKCFISDFDGITKRRNKKKKKFKKIY